MKIRSIGIYSTVTCPYCKMLKKWLADNKIEYTEYLVDQDQEKADEMIAKSKQMGVPVTELVMDDGKSEIVVGFDKPRLAKLLGISE